MEEVWWAMLNRSTTCAGEMWIFIILWTLVNNCSTIVAWWMKSLGHVWRLPVPDAPAFHSYCSARRTTNQWHQPIITLLLWIEMKTVVAARIPAIQAINNYHRSRWAAVWRHVGVPWPDSVHAILAPHFPRQRSFRDGGACRIVDDQSPGQVSQAPTLPSPADYIIGSRVEPLWVDIAGND